MIFLILQCWQELAIGLIVRPPAIYLWNPYCAISLNGAHVCHSGYASSSLTTSKQRGWVVGFDGVDQIGAIIPHIAHVKLHAPNLH